ncbi:MAG: DMT family transporter [Arcobacteraceae bacterium]|nr:DMT family transporter [Arcobacteraceae bacterium]
MPTIKTIATLYLFLAAFGWAMAGVFIRLLPTFEAYEIVALRFLFAFVFLSFFLLFKFNLKIIFIDLKHRITWIYTFIILSCYYIGTSAFQLAPVGETTLLMSIAPLFVIVHKLWINQHTTLKEKRGFLLAIFGIMILFGSNFSNTTYTTSHIFGNFLALGVAFLFALYAILHSRKGEYSPSSLSVTYGMLLVALLPSLYYVSSSITLENQNMLIENLLLFAGLGIFSTAIPTIAITIASKNLPPVISSSVLLLETIFGTFLAYLVLNETPSWYFLISLCVVLVGLMLMILKNKMEIS